MAHVMLLSSVLATQLAALMTMSCQLVPPVEITMFQAQSKLRVILLSSVMEQTNNVPQMFTRALELSVDLHKVFAARLLSVVEVISDAHKMPTYPRQQSADYLMVIVTLRKNALEVLTCAPRMTLHPVLQFAVLLQACVT
jgi:hypothetical protein